MPGCPAAPNPIVTHLTHTANPLPTLQLDRLQPLPQRGRHAGGEQGDWNREGGWPHRWDTKAGGRRDRGGAAADGGAGEWPQRWNKKHGDGWGRKGPDADGWGWNAGDADDAAAGTADVHKTHGPDLKRPRPTHSPDVWF